MSNQNWVEDCPWCGKQLGRALDRQHASSDWANEFEMECPHCGKLIDVEVVAIPSYGVSRSEPEKGDER